MGLWFHCDPKERIRPLRLIPSRDYAGNMGTIVREKQRRVMCEWKYAFARVEELCEGDYPSCFVVPIAEVPSSAVVEKMYQSVMKKFKEISKRLMKRAPTTLTVAKNFREDAKKRARAASSAAGSAGRQVGSASASGRGGNTKKKRARR